jgi:hypothetical protein
METLSRRFAVCQDVIPFFGYLRLSRYFNELGGNLTVFEPH